MLNNDEYWINKTLELAQKAKGFTSPNPMVGAIILSQDGNLVAEGYHQKAGSPHAEIMALQKAGSQAEGGTLYINLEPCSHYGKTPPCTKAIIENKLKKVVIGTLDPNPKVNGQGLKMLKEAEIEVVSGIMSEECLKLNRFFFHWIKTQKPWITMKVAASLDGKIGYSDQFKWITGLEARTKVHQLRSEFDAVLTGSGTILSDNPRLTVRLVEGRNPIRIILDRRLRCNEKHKIFQEQGQNILFTNNKAVAPQLSNTENIQWSGSCLDEVLEILGKKNILSVLLEAGTNLNSAFLEQELVNEIFYFINPSLLGQIESPQIYKGKPKNFKIQNISRFGQDLLLEMIL